MIEHQIYLVNKAGDQASVCWTLIQNATRAKAISIATAKGCVDFNVIEEVDSPEGVSRQRVATVRNGMLT